MNLAVVNQAYLEQADEDDFSVAGTSYHNVNVRATYNDLVRALGKPTFDGESEDGKSHVEWWGYVEDNQGVKVPNSEWTLYDWKESENPKDNPTETYEWHIGAKGSISADNVQDLTVRELQRVGASRMKRNGFRVRAGVWSDPFHDMKKAKELVRIYNNANDQEAYESEDDLLDSLYYVFGDDILFDRIREAGQEDAPILIRERVAEFLNDPNLVETYPQEVVNYLKRGLDIDEEHTNDIIDEALRGVYGDDFVNDLYERTAGASSEMDEDSCVDITGETWVNQDELNSMRSVAEDKYGLQVVPNEHNGYTFLGKKGKLLEFFKSFLDDEEAESVVDAHDIHLFDEGWY